MSQRPRRKSAMYNIKKKVIQEEIESSDSDKNEANTSQNIGKKTYMKSQEEEIFIQKCVEHFDEISDLSTIRGTPESTNTRKHRDKVKSAWESITKDMNELCNV